MKYVLSIILFLVLFVFAILLRNQARWFEPPGLVQRLQVYFTENVAQTSAEHAFPELRTGVYPVSANTLYRTLQLAIWQLGWLLDAAPLELGGATDQSQHVLHAVVTTSLLGFKDDVVIRVQDLGCVQQQPSSRLSVRSSSRVGRADFAANAGHIQNLLAELKHQLDVQSKSAPTETCRAPATTPPAS